MCQSLSYLSFSKNFYRVSKIILILGSDENPKRKAKLEVTYFIEVHFCKMTVCSTLAIFPMAISGILSILQTTLGFFLWSDFPEFPPFALDLIKVSDHIRAIRAWILSDVSSCEKWDQCFLVVAYKEFLKVPWFCLWAFVLACHTPRTKAQRSCNL